MSTKRFYFYRDLINLILLYLLILPFFIAIATGMKAPVSAGEYIALALIIAAFYLTESLIRKFYLLLILQLGVLAGVYYLPFGAVSRFRIISAALLFACWAIYLFFHEKKVIPNISPLCCAVQFAAFAFATGKRSIGYGSEIFYMGILFILLCLVRMLVVNFHELSLSGQFTDEMPVGEIFRNNSFMALGVLILTALSMLFVHADRLILAINKLIYHVILLISRALERALQGEEAAQATSQIAPDYTEMLKMLSEPGEENLFLTQLIRVLDAILVQAVGLIIAYGILKLLVFFYRLLFAGKKASPKKHNTYRVKNEVRERIRNEDGTLAKNPFVKRPDEKIRALYKKELLRHKKAGANVQKTHTPTQNAGFILANSGVNLADATDLYETVRYNTAYEAKEKDVSGMKNLLKRSKASV
ncbi:MAG: hypothetical protein K5739_06595 [Lachnospiraceae bacterium]|nr:hypothetical protein [Lachnospiraceae bacterium]